MSEFCFHAGRSYSSGFEVRDYARLLNELTANKPNGLLWPLVGMRRSGKTWSLKALRDNLRDEEVRLLDFQFPEQRRMFESVEADYFLIDEPGQYLEDDAKGFVERCDALRSSGAKVLVALTPREMLQLETAAGGSPTINRKDLLYLKPLEIDEAKKMASRAEWSQQLLPSFPPDWLRCPFLLELLLQTAESCRELCDNVDELILTTIEEADETRHFYVNATFYDGLSNGQRDVVRSIARGYPVSTDKALLLDGCGLLHLEQSAMRLANPVIANHLPPPFRIHHISDVHIGPKSAESADVKLHGPLADKFAAGVGAGPVRNQYLDHVRSLGASGTAPNLLINSGDIVETGTEEQYELAVQWFAELEEHLADHPRLCSDEPRILMVGGNHDVDWNQALGTDGARRRHKPFVERFQDYPRPRLDLPPASRKLTQESFPELGLSILLLGSAEFGGEVEEDPERACLIDMINELRAQLVETEDENDAEQLVERVARIDPGLVHHEDLRRIREFHWRNMPVRIAVLHHPVSPMPAGTELARYVGLLNAGQVKDTLLAKQFCLVLHGHVHSGWFAQEKWPARHGERTLHIAAAPSLGSREVQEQHGFNEIEMLYEGSECQIVINRFVREGHSWMKKASMGPFAPCEAVAIGPEVLEERTA